MNIEKSAKMIEDQNGPKWDAGNDSKISRIALEGITIRYAGEVKAWCKKRYTNIARIEIEPQVLGDGKITWFNYIELKNRSAEHLMNNSRHGSQFQAWAEFVIFIGNCLEKESNDLQVIEKSAIM